MCGREFAWCGTCGVQQASGLPAMELDESARHRCCDRAACARRAEDARSAVAAELELLADQSVRRREARAMATEDTRQRDAAQTQQRRAERACASLCWAAGLLAVGAVIARPFLTLDDV